MSSFAGLSPVFKTIGKYYTDILEKEAVIIAQYTPTLYDGNPNSTIKPGGYYYSINEENASITYHIPYIKCTWQKNCPDCIYQTKLIHQNKCRNQSASKKHGNNK